MRLQVGEKENQGQKEKEKSKKEEKIAVSRRSRPVARE
jgi:hypothetical protein